MGERSILFARPLVLALLAGQKTQTRRLIQPQPETSCQLPDGPLCLMAAGRALTCPFGKAGDRLWVREKWGFHQQFFDRDTPPEGSIVYAADGNPPGSRFAPWKPSLHMPRSACRIVLEVTGVMAERLADIDPIAAVAEGCPESHPGCPVDWFRGLWDGYYSDRGLGWTANPWVWVVRFKVIIPSNMSQSIPNPPTAIPPTSKRTVKVRSARSNEAKSRFIALRDELKGRLRETVRRAEQQSE